MDGASVIGVDLGGTKIALARYASGQWTVEAEEKIETHADKSFDHVYADMVQLIERHRTANTRAVGIGVPGLIEQPAGMIVKLPNIPGGEQFALKERLHSDLGMTVMVDNDANCFTLAEAAVGAGKGHAVVVGVTLGTGVGGGIVINKKLFHGAHGYAAEIGHMLLMPGQPPYTTDDKRGEVEQFFSGTAMGKRCEEANDPRDYLNGQVCSFMHKDIYQEIAWMCTNLLHLLDPDVIIFGGSAGHALKPHLEQVKEELQRWTLPDTPIPDLKIAELKNAGTLGAALLTVD